MLASSAPDLAVHLFPMNRHDVGEVRYRFTGHQTFPFRYPWMPKAIQGLQEDPNLFFEDDAMVRLGVGKNMVASIRFWAEALGLASFDGRTGEAGPTALGLALFGRDGWDPYLEDPGTLWLLHWRVAETPEQASTWHLTFSRWYKETFARDELLMWLVHLVERVPSARASVGTLKRDIETFLRTYVPSGAGARRAIEDSFDCPLVELGLIRELEDGLYQFVRGAKPTLPIEIFSFALHSYWQSEASEQETLNFERVLYGPGSPGAAFKLSEAALVSLLEELPASSGLRYDETAGLRVILRSMAAAAQNPFSVLEAYYGRKQELPR